MTSTNELRVFISSTFRDLQREREHLVKKVFPSIRSLCRSRGVTFTEVDLRWGLTEESAMLGQVIRTCLEEVDRCRPYFIGMIGNLYGWVPELHEVMRDPELLSKYPWIEDAALDGSSVTEMEFVHGVFNAPSIDGEYAYFYHRTDGEGEVDNPERLGELIDRARATDRPFREFETLEELGSQVEQDLVRMIDLYWPENASPSPLELDRRAHAAFAASRTRAYIPDRTLLKEFREWTANGTTPLVVEGASGLGKSSLAAYLSDTYRRRNPSAFVVEHYVGASDGGGSAVATMRHIMEELREKFLKEEEVPQTASELVRAFPNWLFRAAQMAEDAEVSVLIVIDAVNQLGPSGRRLAWLPKSIPSTLRLMVSTTPGESAEALRARSWKSVEVTPLEDEKVRETIVVRYLGEFQKGISPDQLRRLASDPKGSSPLFLRVVAEELRLHGRHETIDEEIDRYTSVSDLLELFNIVLERMEQDYGEPEVRSLLSLIGTSRSGLSESELLGLSGMSRLTLSHLLSVLDYHLVRKDGLLGFFHDFLRRAVESRYLDSREVKEEVSRSIAYAFERGERTERRGVELLWQYAQIGDDDKLATTLADLETLHLIYHGELVDEIQVHLSRLRKGGLEIEEIYRPLLSALMDERDLPLFIRQVITVASILERLTLWDLALQFFQRAIALAMPAGLREELAISWSGIGNIHSQRAEYPEAITSLERAEDLYREIDDRSGEGRVALAIGGIHGRQGDFAQSALYFQKALDIHHERGNRRGAATATSNLGIIHFRTGDPLLGLRLLREGMESAIELGDRYGVARALGNIGVVYRNLGRYDEAIDVYQRKIAIDEELGDLSAVAAAYGNLGNVYYSQRAFEPALENNLKFASISKEIGDRRGYSTATGTIGIIQHQLGQHDKAIISLKEYLETSEELGNRIGIVIAVGGLGSLYSDLGDDKRALDLFQRQVEVAESMNDRKGVARGWSNIGLVHQNRQEYELALRANLRGLKGQQETSAHFAETNTLDQIASLMLELIENEEKMPAYLPEHFKEVSPASWRADLLVVAAEMVEKMLAISREIEKGDTIFNARVLRARIVEAEGRGEAACTELQSMLTNVEDEPLQLAVLHYWLWKYTAEPSASEEHRGEAARLYRVLFDERPYDKYRRTLRELESASP